MLKTVAAAMTALVVVASPVAHVQSASARQADTSAADWKALTDVRVEVIKAALQLTSDQAKYWPAVEEAIRFRAKDRQERLAKIRERIEKHEQSAAAEFAGNPDPVFSQAVTPPRAPGATRP